VPQRGPTEVEREELRSTDLRVPENEQSMTGRVNAHLGNPKFSPVENSSQTASPSSYT
jgi:hypothetical protein